MSNIHIHIHRAAARDASMVVARILTQGGDVGAEIKRHESPSGSISYGWSGKWGAGSGGTVEKYRQMYEQFLREKRGAKADIPFKD